MKTNRLFLYFSLCLFLLSSCNPDNSDSSDAIPLIDTEATFSDGLLEGSTIYKYDDNGRQIRRINISNTGYFTNVYEYTNTKVENREYDVNEVSHWANLGDLDNNLISNYIIVEDGITSMTGTMEYDDNAFLIGEVVNSWSSLDVVTYTYTVLNNNTVSSTQTVENADSYTSSRNSPTRMAEHFLPSLLLKNQEKIFSTKTSPDIAQRIAGYQFTYTYQFTTILNTIGLENTGIYCNGKQNRNLISSFTTSDGQSVVFSYILDDFLRVIKQSWEENGHDYYTKFTYVE